MTRLKIHTWYNTCTCIHQLWIYKIPLTYRLIWLVLIYLRVIFNIQHQTAVVREKKKAQGKVPVLYNHKQASMIQLELILCKHKDNYVNLTVVFAYIYRCSKIQVHSCYYVGKVKKQIMLLTRMINSFFTIHSHTTCTSTLSFLLI